MKVSVCFPVRDWYIQRSTVVLIVPNFIKARLTINS